MTTRSLIQKGVSYASGDGSTTLTNVIVFTLLLRYLTPAEFGYLSIGQAVSSWVQPLLYMGATLVAVRFIAANPQHTGVITRRMIAMRFASAITVAGCTAAIALNIIDRSLAAVLLAYSFLFLFYPLQPDFIAVGLNRSRVYLLSRWVGSACFLLSTLILTRGSIRAWMVPIAYAASLLASAAYGYFALWDPLHHTSRDRVALGYGPLFRGAIVVVAAQFFQMGQSSIDVILMSTWKVPVALIGEYNAVGRLTQAGVLPFVGLIYSLAPVYVKQFATHDIAKIKELEWRFRICLLLVGIVGAAIILTIGPRVLEIVSGRRMLSAYSLAPIFAAGYLLVALHNSYTAVLVYAGATHLYLATYGLGFLGTLLSALVLIPRFGSIGAGYSELVGLAAILAAAYSFHSRLLRRQQDQSSSSLPAIVAS